MKADTHTFTDISIHAPAWGATRGAVILSDFDAYFNPRARVGRDHGCGCVALKFSHFNPRARVGRDVV